MSSAEYILERRINHLQEKKKEAITGTENFAITCKISALEQALTEVRGE